jgi:Zn-dependent metalloprotease
MLSLGAALGLLLSGAAVAAPPAQLPEAHLAKLRAQLPERTALAEKHVAGLRAGLGLDGGDTFTARGAFTNQQGTAIVHLQHRHLGARVWGSEAIAHVLPEGAIRSITDSVAGGVEQAAGLALSREPVLTAQEAIAAALKRLAPQGAPKTPPTAERVIFPARFTGGIATLSDAVTGVQTLDRARSVHARPAAPFVWSYQVHISLDNPLDGVHQLDCVVDGNTGNVLRVDDAIAFAQAPVSVAALGQGHGTYSGDVPVPAARMGDGTYALFDPSRGSLPNPYLKQYDDDGTGWSPNGLQTWYLEHDSYGNSTNRIFLYQQNPTNEWGDGLPFTSWGNENAKNGQSVGVDVQVGMAQTWDFLKAVFGRNGLDGKGTGVFAEVLETNRYTGADNAFFDPYSNYVWLGAGSYRLTKRGFDSLSEPDLVAHEMFHGVVFSTARLITGAGYEEAALSEGTSAFFSQMVMAWTRRPAGTSDAVIPDTGATWKIGVGAGRGTPLIDVQHPSKDQRSPDGYFNGIEFMDGHYSSGPLMRALYFLANGASADPASDAYSVYLPQGMQGIGSDAAARLWFKVVTERLVGNGASNFAIARKMAVLAALELYPTDPSKALAVESAFAAANVGDAHGASPHTVVVFDGWRHGDYIEKDHPFDYNREYFPKQALVVPRVSVLNNPDTRVEWAVGGPSMFNGATPYVAMGGYITAEGRWQLPNQMAWHSFTATSKADPKQFAEGRCFLINTDTDMDGELDMLDMGGLSFSWYLAHALDPAHSTFQAPWVDDGDVSAFTDAVKNAWPIR